MHHPILADGLLSAFTRSSNALYDVTVTLPVPSPEGHGCAELEDLVEKSSVCSLCFLYAYLVLKLEDELYGLVSVNFEVKNTKLKASSMGQRHCAFGIL